MYKSFDNHQRYATTLKRQKDAQCGSRARCSVVKMVDTTLITQDRFKGVLERILEGILL